MHSLAVEAYKIESHGAGSATIRHRQEIRAGVGLAEPTNNAATYRPGHRGDIELSKQSKPQSMFTSLAAAKKFPKQSPESTDAQPHFRRPSLFVAVRELFFIPILLWVGLRSKSRLLLVIVIIQLLTHFCIVSTSFRCNPRPWCNLPALAFGFVYLTLGAMSMSELMNQDGEDPEKPKTYFDNKRQAIFVLLIGTYIVASHTYAVCNHIDQYEELPQEMLSFLARDTA